MKNGISRRGFLRGLLGTAALAAAPTILLPERKIWAVGAKLEVATPEAVTLFTQAEGRTHRGGLQPIEGQPGLFRNMDTGQVVNIRDFPGGLGWDWDRGVPLLPNGMALGV